MYYRYRKKYIKENHIKRPLTTFNGIDERVHETDIPIKYASDVRGVECRDGYIRSAIGVSPLKSSDGHQYGPTQFGVDNIYPFYLNGARQIIVSSDGRCFRIDDVNKSWEIVGSVYFSGRNSAMFTVGEEPCLIIPKYGGSIYIYNGIEFTDMNLPYTPTTMATHMNRLYLVSEGDECRLRFSGVDDPFNFDTALDKGGEIYLDVEDGKIVKLISHGGNLYIFREYGIYKLMAYADQRDFEVRKIATTTTKIDGSSIAVGDNRMIFRAQDSLYVFDGYNISPVLSELEDSLKDITLSEGCYFNGVYYLSYGKGDRKTSLIRWNVQTHDVAIVDNINIRNFSIIRDNIDAEILAIAVDDIRYIGVLDDSYYCYSQDMDRHYSVSDIDFGIRDRKKTLLGFYVKDSDRYDLLIRVDGKKHKYHVDGRRRYYAINLSGYVYDFSIIPTGVERIASPIIEYKV